MAKTKTSKRASYRTRADLAREARELKMQIRAMADSSPGPTGGPLTGMDAADRPASFHRITEPLEQTIGQDESVEFEGGGPDGEEERIVRPRPEIVEDPAALSEKAAALAFLEEVVTVHIHDTAEANADAAFMIWVNGRGQRFIRNQTVRVKRKFVEGLARAKPVSYRNEEYTDPVDGVRKVRYPARTGLRYAFSVVEDPNPRGAAWLSSLLAQR